LLGAAVLVSLVNLFSQKKQEKGEEK